MCGGQAWGARARRAPSPSWCLCARPPHQHDPRAVCQLRRLQPLVALPADGLPQGWGPAAAQPRDLPGAAPAPPGEVLPTAGRKGAAGPGDAGRGSCHALTPLPCCPGPGQWPGLTLLRWTDQLGLRVPSTPLYLHQPLPPRVLSAAHCGPPCPACTCECLGVRTEGRGWGYKASVGSLVPTAPHPKRDSGYSREESQTREHPQRAVWERAPGKVLEGLWSPQDQTSPGCTSIGGQKAELRRGGSGRSPRSKARGEGPGPSPPLHLDLTKVGPAHRPQPWAWPSLFLHLPGLCLLGPGASCRERGGLGLVQLLRACLSCLLPAAEPGVRPRSPRPRCGDAAALPAVRRPLHATCHLPPQDHRRPGPG